MKTLAFWVALVSMAILCPLSWRTTVVTTEPAAIGIWVTEYIAPIRVLFTTFLVALLVSTIKPVKRPVSEQSAQM